MNIDAANGVFRLVWNLLLIGSVIATGIKLSFLLMRSLHPRIRYGFCLFAFLLAIALPIVATFIWLSPEPAHRRPVVSPLEVAPPLQTSEPADSVSVLDRFPARVPVAIWMLGTLLLLSREWASHRKLHAAQAKWRPASTELRARLSWPDKTALFTSAEDGPCTAGLLKPRVVLPDALLNDMSLTTIQRIAQHELDHARWLDPLANCALRLALAIFWPAAPLWILNEMAGSEREAAADRAAVRNTEKQTEDAAVHYAESLVAVARMLELAKDRAAHAMVPLHSGRRLEERVRRLFRINDSPGLTQLASGTLFLLIGFGSAPWLPVAMQPRDPGIVIRQQIVNVQKRDVQRKAVEKVVKPGNLFTITRQDPMSGETKKWKYLGNGLWVDPLGNRKAPDVMAPWKDLGNGRWLDGEGNEVSHSQLPSWIYLGEGIWYTPHTGDWMKNIQDDETKNHSPQ